MVGVQHGVLLEPAAGCEWERDHDGLAGHTGEASIVSPTCVTWHVAMRVLVVKVNQQAKGLEELPGQELVG